MKERPILFSGAMVRALLAGTKTQTRRAMREQPPADVVDFCTFHNPKGDGLAHVAFDPVAREYQDWFAVCPYGQVGDRLWVRETWQAVSGDDRARHIVTHPRPDRGWLEYAATPRLDEPAYKWRPSIHMPRWASRILLEVTQVRVERLQAISEADAQAEGLQSMTRPPEHGGGTCYSFDGCGEWLSTAAEAYSALWEHINGAGSWAANPWVWAVSFRRLHA